MQGFPPPPDKRVNRSNAFMAAPYNRWSYQHMRTVFPSAPVRTSDTVRPLNVDIDPGISRVAVPRTDGSAADFPAFLRETYTDSFLVLTPERLVYEHYANGMHATQPHQMMSCTKSFAGLFALMAVADGLLDEHTRVTDVVPELAAASAFAEATVGQVVHTGGQAFSQNPCQRLIKPCGFAGSHRRNASKLGRRHHGAEKLL
jgi:hypothetical protein